METSTRNLLVALIGFVVLLVGVLIAMGRDASSLVSFMGIIGTLLIPAIIGADRAAKAAGKAAEAKTVGDEALHVAQRVERQTNGILQDAVRRLPDDEQHRTEAVKQGFVSPPPKSDNSHQLTLDDTGTGTGTR